MSMASSQISTDTVSSMSGSYIAPGTEEEGEALPSPLAASRAPSEGEVREGSASICLALCFTHGFQAASYMSGAGWSAGRNMALP